MVPCDKEPSKHHAAVLRPGRLKGADSAEPHAGENFHYGTPINVRVRPCFATLRIHISDIAAALSPQHRRHPHLACSILSELPSCAGPRADPRRLVVGLSGGSGGRPAGHRPGVGHRRGQDPPCRCSLLTLLILSAGQVGAFACLPATAVFLAYGQVGVQSAWKASADSVATLRLLHIECRVFQRARLTLAPRSQGPGRSPLRLTLLAGSPTALRVFSQQARPQEVLRWMRCSRKAVVSGLLFHDASRALWRSRRGSSVREGAGADSPPTPVEGTRARWATWGRPALSEPSQA